MFGGAWLEDRVSSGTPRDILKSLETEMGVGAGTRRTSEHLANACHFFFKLLSLEIQSI